MARAWANRALMVLGALAGFQGSRCFDLATTINRPIETGRSSSKSIDVKTSLQI